MASLLYAPLTFSSIGMRCTLCWEHCHAANCHDYPDTHDDDCPDHLQQCLDQYDRVRYCEHLEVALTVAEAVILALASTIKSKALTACNLAACTSPQSLQECKQNQRAATCRSSSSHSFWGWCSSSPTNARMSSSVMFFFLSARLCGSVQHF